LSDILFCSQGRSIRVTSNLFLISTAELLPYNRNYSHIFCRVYTLIVIRPRGQKSNSRLQGVAHSEHHRQETALMLIEKERASDWVETHFKIFWIHGKKYASKLDTVNIFWIFLVVVFQSLVFVCILNELLHLPRVWIDKMERQGHLSRCR
jgi:hypothetical protein